MRFLNLFGRQRSASTAQQRLQVLLMHERSAPGNADLIPILREDILAAIGKHIPVDSDRVQVRVERGDAVSLLEAADSVRSPARTEIISPLGASRASRTRPHPCYKGRGDCYPAITLWLGSPGQPPWPGLLLKIVTKCSCLEELFSTPRMVCR